MKLMMTALLITALAVMAGSGSQTGKPSLKLDAAPQVLSILTLNTWGLPVWYGKATSKSRHTKLAQSVADVNPDIVCLQETFHSNIRKEIERWLSQHYFTLTDWTCNRRVHKILKMDCYGGLITLSRFPIVQEDFYPFPITEEYSLIEVTGRKGFLVSIIDLEGKKTMVVNTHLYSGSGKHAEIQRLKQATYMDSIIRNTDVYRHLPIILAGDMNFQHPGAAIVNKEKETSEVFQFMNDCQLWEEGEDHFSEIDFTYDHFSNFFASKNEGRQKLDYIFWKNIDPAFTPLTGEVIFKGDASVSDHNGYLFEFKMATNHQQNRHEILYTQF